MGNKESSLNSIQHFYKKIENQAQDNICIDNESTPEKWPTNR